MFKDRQKSEEEIWVEEGNDEYYEDWEQVASNNCSISILGLQWSDQFFSCHPRIESKDIGTCIGDFFIVAMKEQGVEPGFLAVKVDDKFIKRFNKQYDESFNIVGFMEAMAAKQFDQRSLKVFAEQLLKEGKGQEEIIDASKLDLWLFKGDFDKGTLDTISPPQESLQQSTTIQKIPKLFQATALSMYQLSRIIQRKYQNLYTILECIAADDARLCGANSHELYLFRAQYPDKTLKYLQVSKWESAMRTFKGRLAGSHPQKHQNFIVIPNPGSGELEIDRTILDLEMYLALLISHGDFDAINNGGNKGTLGNELFIFDLGHAFREENIFIKTLQPDLVFNELYNTCKNFSIFYDAPLSQLYKGMFFLLKTLSDETIKEIFTEEELLRVHQAQIAYQKQDDYFKEKLEKIPTSALQTVFTAYVMHFTTLSEKATHPQLKKEYAFYATEISKQYKFALEARTKMIKICKDYMQLTPYELDFIHNLNKLSSKTSIRSGDQQFLLNHLRVHPNEKLYWIMKKDTKNNFIIISANLKKSNHSISASQLKKLIVMYLDWLNNKDTACVELKNSDRMVKLIFPMEYQGSIEAAFSEENIKEFKLQQTKSLSNKQSKPYSDSRSQTYAPGLFNSRRDSQLRQKSDAELEGNNRPLAKPSILF